MINASLSVLLVEDNQDDATLFRMALAKLNLPVKLHIAWDGMEGRDYLKGIGQYQDRPLHPFPDLVLLDLNMPRLNGLELLQWIRQDSECRHLLVHVLSASSRRVDICSAYELGANSYAVKPSRSDELAALIHGLITFHKFVCLPQRKAKPVMA
ncbi:MAG: response regulator [Verrucomicrobiota bacterium]